MTPATEQSAARPGELQSLRLQGSESVASQTAKPDWERVNTQAKAPTSNIDVIIFYVLASAIVAVTLYHFHRRQV
jgi:hypothetical protein